jgi:ribosomal protein S18 acetylase RimI-like enzyme
MIIVEIAHRLSPRSSAPLPIGFEYELRPIVVMKEERASGVANELIKALLKDARVREFDRIHLFVDEYNLAAQSCYFKAGFSEVKQVWNGENTRLLFERSTKDIM